MFPDFSLYIRVVRILPIVAGAALLGGLIGGVSVFAIDSALTPTPLHRDMLVGAQAKAEPPAIRSVGGSVPDPSAGMSPGAPVQAQIAPAQPQLPAPAQPVIPVQSSAVPPPLAPVQSTVAVQAQTAAPAPTTQAAWPDALSRAHTAPAADAVAVAPQPAPAPVSPASASQNPAQESVKESGNDPVAMSQDRKPAQPAKKRATVMSRTLQPGTTDSARAADAPNARPVYYDEYNQPAGRVVVRRQRPADADDADDAPNVLPPQPPPRPLFWGGGLFGGGARSDDGN